jgi:hypothetical protein
MFHSPRPLLEIVYELAANLLESCRAAILVLRAGLVLQEAMERWDDARCNVVDPDTSASTLVGIRGEEFGGVVCVGFLDVFEEDVRFIEGLGGSVW